MTEVWDMRIAIAVVGLLGALLAAPAPQAATYSPHADERFPRRVLWGDTHLHSNLSLDANMSGNRGLTPADAYRFASGEVVTANNGMQIKLRRPLDFLLVSDHAEYLGVMAGLNSKDTLLLENETARRWEAALSAGDYSPMSEFAARWRTPCHRLYEARHRSVAESQQLSVYCH